MKESEIIKKLKQGAIIIYPTDTVYGIGCLNDCLDAVQKVFIIKNPSANPGDYKVRPFLVGFSDIEQAKEYVELKKKQEEFIKSNCDKGASFIVKKKGGGTLGIRILIHPLINGIIKKAGPLITTSANLTGKLAPSSFEEIDRELLKKMNIVLKGECRFKRPSTIFDLTESSYNTLR